MHVLLLSNDLMTTSQIEAAVRSAGGEVSVVTTGGAPTGEAASGVDVVVLDLSTTSDIATTVSQFQQWSPTPRIIAFGPHVHAAKLNAAREAGCDQVLSRGQFLPNVAEVIRVPEI